MCCYQNVNETSNVHSLTNGLGGTDMTSEHDYSLDSNRTSPRSSSLSNATMSPLSASVKHRSKYQRLGQASPASSIASNYKPSEITEMDAKFNEFIEFFSREKENELKYKTRLELARVVPPRHPSPGLAEKTSNDQTNTAKLDEFFSRLSEEKNKNKEFNIKLSQMLGES